MDLKLFQLTGKNALVTGSRKGLGAGIALALAQAGANVACHGRSSADDGIIAKIQACGVQSFYVSGDVGDPAVCEGIFEGVLAQFGTVDILVNNAGIIRRAPAVDYSLEDWNEIIAVNLTAVFRLSQLAARHMMERGKGGKIVNIASLLSFQGGILVPAYAAAKAGVAQLTRAMANEWAIHNINVNAIAPGYMVTDNTAALRSDATRSRQILERIPAGRWGNPEDLAGAAIFLSSAASDYVHGHVLAVDGGWLGR
ncbi:MAG TPA: 2-dehydro-3-deoxy-D-gluconate 5-dehydrogenase KduD [Candidatus Sulfotelmatobacter sp.]|nr:2-dehydro-3-deoxy-D-gluconate 5-dehydrogenase KduD [Candidatus Sulfotelmatobacter sp.]